MNTNKILFSALILLGAYASTYIVPEGEMGALYRFGTPLKSSSEDLVLFKPGLHFAIPIINTIRHIDLDTQTSTWRSQPFPSAGGKYVQLDYYLEWNITDLSLYLSHNQKGTFPKTIQKIFEQNLQKACVNLDITNIATQQKTLIASVLIPNFIDQIQKTGIKITNAGIMHIYNPENINDTVTEHQQKIYAQLATQYNQNTGDTLAKTIRDKTKLDVNTIVTEAQAKATKTKAEADSQAANIYNNAYSQDPEFYLWQKSLDVYKKNFTAGKNILVLQPGGVFLQYLKPNIKITKTDTVKHPSLQKTR